MTARSNEVTPINKAIFPALKARRWIGKEEADREFLYAVLKVQKREVVPGERRVRGYH